MKCIASVLLTGAVLLLFSPSAVAGSPPNDECDTCIFLETMVPYSGTTVGAAGEDVSSCAFNDWADVWFCWDSPCDGDVTISLCGSSFDTTLAVYDACGGIELACNDDFCGLQSEVTLRVRMGMQYIIRVAGYNGATGDYTIIARFDNFNAASFFGGFEGGGNGYGEGWYYYPNFDWWNIWYPNEYAPDRPKRVYIRFSLDFDDGFAEVALNWATREWSELDPPPPGEWPRPPLPQDVEDPAIEDAFIGRETLLITQEPGDYEFEFTLPYCPEWISVDIRGNNYIIEGYICHICEEIGPPLGACCVNNACVATTTEADCTDMNGDWYEGETCPEFICPIEPPPNDECENCIDIATLVPVTGTTIGSTGTDISSCAFNDWADVWYCWTAPCDADAVFSLCGSEFDTTLAIYDACDGNELACNDDDCGLQSRLTLRVEAGMTYYIRVAGFDGATGNFTLRVILDNFFASNFGGIFEGGGNGFGDGWYFYPNFEWWNIWFPNEYDPQRRKFVYIELLADFAPNGFLEVAVNWSTPQWTELDPPPPGEWPRPPLPQDVQDPELEDRYIGRISEVIGNEPGVYGLNFVLPYCPEWISVDVRGVGYNIRGFICHVCVDPCQGQILGDANCDGVVNNFDIDAFVLALTGGQAAWEAAYGDLGCTFFCVNDINGDGAVNNFDIDPFVELLVGG